MKCACTMCTLVFNKRRAVGLFSTQPSFHQGPVVAVVHLVTLEMMASMPKVHVTLSLCYVLTPMLSQAHAGSGAACRAEQVHVVHPLGGEQVCPSSQGGECDRRSPRSRTQSLAGGCAAALPADVNARPGGVAAQSPAVWGMGSLRRRMLFTDAAIRCLVLRLLAVRC
jgi:hypothetical protein